MSKSSEGTVHFVVRRLFFIQLGLIGAVLLIILLGFIVESMQGEERSFGFFWFAFAAGCFGSSIALLRRVRLLPRLAGELGQTWIATLMPLLYGGLMASVTYLLFMSGILSGVEGQGLLITNLFPTFDTPSVGTPSITRYIAVRPASILDVGKLLVWCFLAGYSERFVLGILAKLEAVTQSEKPPKKKTKDEAK